MADPDSLAARLAEWSYRNAAIALAVTDAEGSLLEWNPAFAAMCPGDEGLTAGQPIGDAMRQPPKSPLVTAYNEALAAGSGHAVLVVACGSGGEPRQWDVTLDHDPASGLVHVLGTDLTRESRLAAEVRARTVRDRLTGLPNRDAFVDELDAVLVARQPVALFIVDVDGFTLVNDTYGHEFGDAVLVVLGSRLSHVAGVRNVVARIGGDQFAVMLRRVSDPGVVATASERLRRAATAELVIDHLSVHLNVSMGFAITHGGDDTTGAAELLRKADTALSRAGESGGNRTQEFHPDFYVQMERRMRTEADLRRALGTAQLDADVQGVFRADERALVGFEALARWRHPVRGTVPPGEFIEVAGRHGMLDHVLRAVLDRSLTTLAPWLAADARRYVAANVAPSQLTDGQVEATIAAALAMSGVPPRQLVIEITERELVVDKESIAVLQDLSAMGLRIAIDDFGSGASSLGYLWTFPVSMLKLDRSLTNSILTDDTARRVVASLVGLAGELDLSLVAEGVELDDELAALVDLGCERVQGFLLHRPARVDDVESLVGSCGPVAPLS
ncbi:MAG: bifunctional diguanylate cyclase/phosphodiesterase [Actinomycetota bacterium]